MEVYTNEEEEEEMESGLTKGEWSEYTQREEEGEAEGGGRRHNEKRRRGVF